MAATTGSAATANTLYGKVLLKETGAGIPDLLVVVYDLDPGIRSDEGFPDSPSIDRTAPLPAPGAATLGDRLGSILTSSDGSWSLAYADDDFRRANPSESRPDLQLFVLAPEDADSPNPPTVLFDSKLTRVNSGRTEAYLVRIAAAQLEKAGIAVPTAHRDDDADASIEQHRARKTRQKNLRAGLALVNRQLEAQMQAHKTEFRETLHKIIRPDVAVIDAMINAVKPTETIEEVQQRVYTRGTGIIDDVLAGDDANPRPGKGIAIHLILSDDDRQALQPFKFSFDGKDYYNVPEDRIEALLFRKEQPGNFDSILFAGNPISKYCIQKSADQKCAELHTGLGSGPDPHDGDTTGDDEPPVVTAITKDDIPLFLGGILADKTSSRFHGQADYKSQRPDDRSVQAKVDSFSLKKGPADTTAFYDFHSLQIAFQHVWQQLLDETLVNLTETVDQNLETAGKRGLFDRVRERMQGLRAFGPNILVASIEDAYRFVPHEVPSDIAAAFDISLAEYDALGGDDKALLLAIAQDVNAKELIPAWATYASVRREQGEKIIDNVRINKPFATNELLKELQERLLSKYEFTVFAADRDYQSVNFGLLNTFRQKWEPISYQAGKLVRTMPLSPKEERKFSAKITQTLKTTRKQAQKNNSSLQNEVSTTSRAESEIVAKAHDKSNFNMSVKLDYSHISSEVGFGKDAEKDTSQSKKDFREAVIKAAQEYKEERSIEIETEESATSEYTESGSITNPNEELSLTCLFYELQRRYRISEQLYRVMPVVLVAQQVPAPNQITEAWIVAHDWILNRVLLDDSFRATLLYLAQNNVGDDFALRELRKNLRQQRTLVANLQIEFSKLRQDVENKYAAMERAVQERINEEHEKRTYRWWWWWNDADRPDTPPDPEMAKALEQAATDEHKYAVEKAEKLALSVQRETNALQQMTQRYNETMREHLDRITQIRRLVAHVKNNILYYMQAIWSMEPPDQRYMRLYKVLVPQFEATRSCVVEDTPSADLFEAFREPGRKRHNAWLHGKIARKADGAPDVTYRQLVEVADLDTVLGFKGNYMIFPLKQHNALTSFMAAPYVDEAFGAMDPDQLGNVNLEEFSKYVCCLHDESPDEYERLKPVLKAWLEALLADPLRNGDEIVVPTGSLFIELLPSDRSLLEDFKLQHREWDVYKVQAEVRRMELENIRYAARLLDARMEDPDVEKKIVVANGVEPVIDVDDA
ncbi:MAG: hypothetical protein LT102_00660 [Burkholderiaceae bacterium]|nr:hypothetical protein [Burkholderiaceae bacterium]